jgi:hypothetical protein
MLGQHTSGGELDGEQTDLRSRQFTEKSRRGAGQGSGARGL